MLHIKEHRKKVRVPGTGWGVSIAEMHAGAIVQNDYGNALVERDSPSITRAGNAGQQRNPDFFIYPEKSRFAAREQRPCIKPSSLCRQWSYLSIFLWRLLNAGVDAGPAGILIRKQDREIYRNTESCLLIFRIVTFL